MAFAVYKMSSTDLLLQKIQFIAASTDESLRLILNEEWSSTNNEYRLHIRHFLEEKLSPLFNREQLVLLNDLNWLPEAQNKFISISHCKKMGGISHADFKHGLDIEETKRISVEILKRTCTATEFSSALKPEFLWVAKEAALKALSGDHGYTRSIDRLLVTDLICQDWQSHFENQVFSFRLKPVQTLEFIFNKGFIFSDNEKLFCIFFK